jgi:hypothetical protein
VTVCTCVGPKIAQTPPRIEKMIPNLKGSKTHDYITFKYATGETTSIFCFLFQYNHRQSDEWTGN